MTESVESEPKTSKIVCNYFRNGIFANTYTQTNTNPQSWNRERASHMWKMFQSVIYNTNKRYFAHSHFDCENIERKCS